MAEMEMMELCGGNPLPGFRRDVAPARRIEPARAAPDDRRRWNGYWFRRDVN